MNTQSDAPRERLHPLTLMLRLIKTVPALAMAIIPAIAWMSESQQRLQTFVLFGCMALYGAVALPLILAHYLRFSYRITGKEIIIRSGVFRRRKRSIPIERVQNVEIQRTLLPRLAGLASVKIMTAGSNEAEGVLEYTSHQAALNIRDMVRRRDEPGRSTAAAEAVPSEPDLLAAMPLERVFLAGTFRFSLVYIAIIFSGLAYVQQLSGFTEQDLLDWIGSEQAETIASEARRLGWIIALATILITCLLAWFTGLIETVTRYYNFRLRRLGDKLVRSHGLLTLQEATIPLKRIQALVVYSNFLMRFFGWFRLELQIIGHDVSGRRSRMALPLARWHELAVVGPHIRPFVLPGTYERVSKLTIRRTFIRYAAVFSLIVVPVAFFFGSWIFWVFLVLPLLGYLAKLQYRNHGYRFSDNTLYIRRGVFRQHIWVVPAERFQAFMIRGTFFQRRLGLRTVSVDTAGAGYLRYPRIVDLPEATAHAVTSRLYAGLGSSVAAQPGQGLPAQVPASPTQ